MKFTNAVYLAALLAVQFAATAEPQRKTQEDRAVPVAGRAVLVADKSESLPTGACYITAGTVKNCTSGMTQRSCYATASKVGGVADWREGQRCK